MNKKHVSIITAGILFLLSACSDNIVETNDNQPVNTKAKVNVFVRDNFTGEPISGATVKLLKTGEQKTTKIDGTVTFNNVYTGDHQIMVTNEDYARVVSAVASVPSTDGDTENGADIYIARDQYVEVNLPKLEGRLEGYLLYQYNEEKDKPRPARGAEVRLVLPDVGALSFVDKYITVTVNDSGRYFFDKLPRGVSLGTSSIFSLEYTPDHEEKAFKPQQILSLALTTNNEQIVYAPTRTLLIGNTVGNFVFLGCTNPDQDISPIVCEFNQDIDTDMTGVNAIVIRKSDEVTSLPLAVTTVWEGSKLIITPFQGGRWDVEEDEIYVRADKALRSVDGNTLATGSLTKVQLPVIDISALAVAGFAFQKGTGDDEHDYNSKSVSLRWNKIYGATGYKIYAKATAGDKRDDYVLVYDAGGLATAIDLDGNEGDFGIQDLTADTYAPCGGTACKFYFAEGNTVEFIIQAYNRKYETSLEKALLSPIVAEDNIKPDLRVVGGNNAWYNNTANGKDRPENTWILATFNNQNYTVFGNSQLKSKFLSAGAAVNFITSCYEFREPMDVATPIPNATSGRLTIAHNWKDPRNLCLTLSIAAGAAVEEFDFVYEISGDLLKDKSGNSFEHKYNYTDPNTGVEYEDQAIDVLRIRFFVEP
jgi:hypothetical protein